MPESISSRSIVAAPDLPHVDIPALRRASEELVVTLQSASAKLGLQRADAGGRIAMIVRRLWIGALALGLLLAGPARARRGLSGRRRSDDACLPKTELNEDALDKPREVFHSEVAGGKSYMVNLGNLAFSSPAILGGVARQAGVSCGTCHVNGAGNAKFFMPKMSTRPGNFDTTGPLFNPKADNFVLDPVTDPEPARRALSRALWQ